MTENKKQQLSSLFMYYYTIRNIGDYSDFPEEPKKDDIVAWSKQFTADKNAQGQVIKALESPEQDALWSEVEGIARQMISEKESTSTEEPDGQNMDDILSAKKGAYLKKLKNTKTKKCSCGCDIVSAKDSGGTLVSRCACGCNVK